ncbi:hypothetical protein NFI96_010268 [Prochilodus magdalenae]|nr:hypothetical protein NFI96_010268 [Prochilodus magdalenae]
MDYSLYRVLLYEHLLLVFTYRAPAAGVHLQSTCCWCSATEHLLLVFTYRAPAAGVHLQSTCCWCSPTEHLLLVFTYRAPAAGVHLQSTCCWCSPTEHLLLVFSYRAPAAGVHLQSTCCWCSPTEHLLLVFTYRAPAAGVKSVCGMKEQDLMCIKLHGVNRIGLKKIIDFIYTAKLSLNMENLQDTLEAASFLQILPVLDFCKVFLISGVSLENCVEVGRIANAYNLTEVDKYVNNFILKNFPSLLGTGEFVKLPFERLAFVLSSNSLKHCSELDLFKSACRWLRYEDGRMDYAAKLMRNIRFPLMSPADLINHVQTVDFMRTDNTCVNLLLEASNYQMMPYMQPVMQSERTAIRSDSSHLVTLGGVLRQQLVVSKELRLFDEKAHEWKALAPMDAPRYQHGIAVIGNFLYVVGGQSNYDTKGKTAVDTVFRYDPRYNKWMQVACLNEKRTFFHLSALKGYLYAVGGRNAAGELGESAAAVLAHCPVDEKHGVGGTFVLYGQSIMFGPHLAQTTSGPLESTEEFEALMDRSGSFVYD